VLELSNLYFWHVLQLNIMSIFESRKIWNSSSYVAPPSGAFLQVKLTIPSDETTVPSTPSAEWSVGFGGSWSIETTRSDIQSSLDWESSFAV
jgi:hypothetical protein